MKNILSIGMLLLMVSSMITTPIFVDEKTSEKEDLIVLQEQGNLDTIITEESNIRRFQESLSEEYDPNLVAVRRIIKSVTNKGESEITPSLLAREYYIKNQKNFVGIDCGTILRIYKRPAGEILINEDIEIATRFTADSGISADVLSKKLGFSVDSKDTLRVE